MPFTPRFCWWLLALGLSLGNPAFAPSRPPSPASAAQNSAAEAALRALSEAFFKTWAAKDLGGHLRLWSTKSPELEARRKALQELFAGSERIELRGLAPRAVKLGGDKARVRAEVDAQVIDAQTGKEKAGYGKMLRTLECVMEAGAWKVWREISTFDELAAALAAAQSEQQRAALMAEEKELATAVLVRALSGQGNRSYFKGEYPRALTSYHLAYWAAEQIGDQAGLAGVLSNIGNVYRSQGAYAQALEHYQKSLVMSEALKDKAGMARSVHNIGNVYFLQGAYAQALEYYQKSSVINEALEDKAGMARSMNNIGNVYFSQGIYAQALEHYQKSLAMSETLDDKDAIARALNNIGSVHKRQSNYTLALECYRRSLAVGEALGTNPVIADALGNIGIVNNLQGDYAQALECNQKSLIMRESLGDKVGIARTLNNIGVVHENLGNYMEALEHHQKSLAMHEALGNKTMMAVTLANLGIIFGKQGNYIRALECYQKSLPIQEAALDRLGIANTLTAIGFIHRLQGNYAQALEYYQKGMTIFEALGNKAGIAGTLNNLGAVHRLQGNNTQAVEYFQKSLAMMETIGDQAGIASALNNIGLIYGLQNNYAQALEHLQKSLAMSETLGNKAGIADTLNNIGEVYVKQGRHSQALDFAERASTLARRIGDPDTLRQARLTSGAAYRALEEPVRARAAFEEAITTTEAMRVSVAGGEVEQQRFFASRVSPYHAMADLLIAEGRPAEALTFAERAKARVLLDVLQTGRANIAKARGDAEREQERKLRAELISLNTQVIRASQQGKPDQSRLGELKSLREKARLNYEAFQTSLYAAHPELRVQRGEAPVITAEETAALLPDSQSALLEYVVTDDLTYLFAITKATGSPAADVQVYTLPIKRDELTEQTESLRRQLAGRDLGFRASARRLYQLLLKPAEAQLRGKTDLVIIPDDKLWELPFQALLAEGDRYMIEKCAVSYAPSLTVLREMKSQGEKRRAVAAGSAVLAMGNPVIGRETIERAALTLRDGKLDPLPEAEAEVKALGRLYGAARSKVYVGAEAREDRVKTEAGKAGVLHFATHGILNDASPMYSHLVLAQGDTNEDGLLEAWELMQLDLKAELAVLSACETARGRFGAGEGVIGLAWAMFVAGAPATVVSQWKVESAGTRELMLGFHQQLRAPAKARAAKAEALRQAALKVLKSPGTSHPFYWAGFVLVGDGR